MEDGAGGTAEKGLVPYVDAGPAASPGTRALPLQVWIRFPRKEMTEALAGRRINSGAWSTLPLITQRWCLGFL